ncbi:hypothetical protein Rs2_46657 [Raphanus sativus]|nr:hypothetical protein Rs2_46657 [Raphanus sativus]
MGRTGNGTLVRTEASAPSTNLAAEAPSVLWDVGLDLLDYPEFYNAQRDGLSQGESSTGSTAIICNQLGAAVVPSEIGNQAYYSDNGAGVVERAAGTTIEKLNNSLPGPSLTLSLTCGSEEPDAQPRPTANVDNTSSEKSDTESGF